MSSPLIFLILMSIISTKPLIMIGTTSPLSLDNPLLTNKRPSSSSSLFFLSTNIIRP
ncbi:hypothetical protein GLYMA_11G182133v4 [Glycine max]|nr:hypothetical protein GLYMA_11G182133v4 [Glycine max]KAH1159196.1 hypothetical protein GYH30_031093 [Glycine max]